MQVIGIRLSCLILAIKSETLKRTPSALRENQWWREVLRKNLSMTKTPGQAKKRWLSKFPNLTLSLPGIFHRPATYSQIVDDEKYLRENFAFPQILFGRTIECYTRADQGRWTGRL